jgi:3-dehydroquinate synthase
LPQAPQKTVRVELGDRSYDVLIGSGNLDQLGQEIGDRLPIARSIVITDDQVGPLYAAPALESLRQIAPAELLQVPAGESSKSVGQAESLWEALLRAGAARDSLIVGLGGGVVGDLAGFVAASYARGLAFVQVPTTVLAQVDSSVGGKVGINLSTAKNMVGAFWQPRCVVIDLNVLTTLNDRQFCAGLAEVIKYGVIEDEAFFESLERNVARIRRRDLDVMAELVARSCQIKAAVVADDETERSGRRAILNYGHTFAHAIEAYGQYRKHLHGEAVALGMLCASSLALRLREIDEAVLARQRALIEACGLPVTMPAADTPRLLDLMRSDKKAQAGQLVFVLPTRLGEVQLVSGIDEDLVCQSIESVYA